MAIMSKRLNLSDGLGLAGLVLAILLVVLDKAGLLKGSILYFLLAGAAVMTIPLALNLSWVSSNGNFRVRQIAWRKALACLAIAAFYLVLAGWVRVGRQRDLVQNTPVRDHFSVSLRSGFVSDSGPLTMFMLGFESPSSKTISPIFYLLYFQITNIVGMPLRINSINVSVGQSEDGPWEKLFVMPSDSVLYQVGSHAHHPFAFEAQNGIARLATPPSHDDLQEAAVISMEPHLENRLRADIDSDSPTIGGWVAFDSLRHRGMTPGPMFFRVEIEDATNHKEQHVTEAPEARFGENPMSGFTGVIQSSGETRDLRYFDPRYFSDPFPPAPVRAP